MLLLQAHIQSFHHKHLYTSIRGRPTKKAIHANSNLDNGLIRTRSEVEPSHLRCRHHHSDPDRDWQMQCIFSTVLIHASRAPTDANALRAVQQRRYQASRIVQRRSDAYANCSHSRSHDIPARCLGGLHCIDWRRLSDRPGQSSFDSHRSTALVYPDYILWQ